MSDRLFGLDEVPEVPLFREPRRRALPASGSSLDARFRNDYPPEWHRCTTCRGAGRTRVDRFGQVYEQEFVCPDCLGMGSVKARVRLEAGHRCVRCQHPFVTKGDAKMLGVEPSPGRWSPCDERCTHGAPIRWRIVGQDTWQEILRERATVAEFLDVNCCEVEAEWRVLTVHHLDGDKANLRWWNLLAACQRCHLEVQGKVVMERVYPHPHSPWFRPFVAGYYGWVYLGEDLMRTEVEARMDELLGLELAT